MRVVMEVFESINRRLVFLFGSCFVSKRQRFGARGADGSATISFHKHHAIPARLSILTTYQ